MKKLTRMVRGLRYRLKLFRTLHSLEEEITALVEKGGGEIISGEFKISLNAEGQVQVSILEPSNVRQLVLPLEEGGAQCEDGYVPSP